jgi:hypothetical protein
MEQIRDCDALPYLRLKQKMRDSDCLAVLTDGRRLEVFLYNDKPAFEIDRQFYFTDSYPGFARYELKPVTAPIPEARVQIVNEAVIEEPVVDTSGQRLRLQLARNSDLIYKRNILRQVFGNLLVREFLGVGERDSSTRYWNCLCKAHGRNIVATQGDLVTQTVTDCNNAKTPTETIVNRGGRLP